MGRWRRRLGLAAHLLGGGTAVLAADLRLAREQFVLVASAHEPEAVQRAVIALQRDVHRVLGFRPEIRRALPPADSTPAVVVVNRATLAPGATALPLKPLDGFESHRVYTDPARSRVHLDGHDARGAIYAIFTFSEQFLGVPPLHCWSSWQPETRDAIVVPGDCDIFFRSPQVRYRSVLTGDTDFFTPWRARSPDHDDIWLETVQRLKLNTVEGYSTVEPGHRLSAYARLVAGYGLVLTSHHISGLNTSFATWETYWREERQVAPPRLRLADEAAIREFFRYNAETVHRSGIENLWTLAFRGARDQPFWVIFEDAPTDDPGRAAVINRMLQLQLETIREVTGEAAPHVRITLYDEMADLMAKGLLQPPETPNLILTFVAARRDPYPSEDLVRYVPPPGVKLGYYMNFGFASTGAHVVPAEGPWKMEFNYRYVVAKSPLEFSVVNVGCMREFLLELAANAQLLWDMGSYDTDRFLQQYCAQYFGPEQAAAAAQLFREYYDAFWEPKPPEFSGLERQFVFQDLRYARAFDHLSRGFQASPAGPNLNPLRDIGYERVPGRTFRLDLNHLGVANQVEALLVGMQRTIPKFDAVAARCTELMTRLAPNRRTYFNDSLRVPSYYMAHLSRALYQYVLAYQKQAARDESILHLGLAHEELARAQAYLFEAQHGVFSEWYSGAMPMTRTFEIERVKASILALQRQARENR